MLLAMYIHAYHNTMKTFIASFHRFSTTKKVFNIKVIATSVWICDNCILMIIHESFIESFIFDYCQAGKFSASNVSSYIYGMWMLSMSKLKFG